MPLNLVLQNGAPESFSLNDEQLRSFNTFIEKVCSSLVLALRKPGLPYLVDIDASAYGLGCTLFQVHEE